VPSQVGQRPSKWEHNQHQQVKTQLEITSGQPKHREMGHGGPVAGEGAHREQAIAFKNNISSFLFLKIDLQTHCRNAHPIAAGGHFELDQRQCGRRIVHGDGPPCVVCPCCGGRLPEGRRLAPLHVQGTLEEEMELIKRTI